MDTAVLLLKSIVTHEHSSHVAASCIQALVTLISTLDSNKRKCKSNNACAVFVRSLQKHEKVDKVVHWVCCMIYNICDAEDSTRDKLGEERACETIIPAFSLHTSDPIVSEWCFKAIVRLSQLELNRLKFFRPECFDTCSRALKVNIS